MKWAKGDHRNGASHRSIVRPLKHESNLAALCVRACSLRLDIIGVSEILYSNSLQANSLLEFVNLLKRAGTWRTNSKRSSNSPGNGFEQYIFFFYKHCERIRSLSGHSLEYCKAIEARR